MPSPFPGMDPFLESESRWQIFHGWFIYQVARLAMSKANDLDCWIDIERDAYRKDPSGDMVSIGEPDDVFTVSSGQQPWLGNGGGVAAVAVPQSVREIVFDPAEAHQYRQQYLVVRDNQAWPRALAVVELLSPANKSGSYATTYNAKRAKFLAARTHFMEIDLHRGGDNPLRGHFPDLAPTP